MSTFHTKVFSSLFLYLTAGAGVNTGKKEGKKKKEKKEKKGGADKKEGGKKTPGPGVRYVYTNTSTYY